MKLVARCLSPRFARLQAARRCAHTRRAEPPDLDQATLSIQKGCQGRVAAHPTVHNWTALFCTHLAYGAIRDQTSKHTLWVLAEVVYWSSPSTYQVAYWMVGHLISKIHSPGTCKVAYRMVGHLASKCKAGKARGRQGTQGMSALTNHQKGQGKRTQPALEHPPLKKITTGSQAP